MPLQLIATGVRYQPAPLGGRLVSADVAGGSASILSSFVVIVVVPPSLVALQVLVVPVFGPGIWMAGSQPVVEMMGDSLSLTAQPTTMKLPSTFWPTPHRCSVRCR